MVIVKSYSKMIYDGIYNGKEIDDKLSINFSYSTTIFAKKF